MGSDTPITVDYLDHLVRTTNPTVYDIPCGIKAYVFYLSQKMADNVRVPTEPFASRIGHPVQPYKEKRIFRRASGPHFIFLVQ